MGRMGGMFKAKGRGKHQLRAKELWRRQDMRFYQNAPEALAALVRGCR
jgi:hypothetical protein